MIIKRLEWVQADTTISEDGRTEGIEKILPAWGKEKPQGSGQKDLIGGRVN